MVTAGNNKKNPDNEKNLLTLLKISKTDREKEISDFYNELIFEENNTGCCVTLHVEPRSKVQRYTAGVENCDRFI